MMFDSIRKVPDFRILPHSINSCSQFGLLVPGLETHNNSLTDIWLQALIE
jgi:hypothetical protein